MGESRKSGRPKSPDRVFRTLYEASDRLGIPYASTRRLVVDGYLPGKQLGNSKRWWVKATDLERFASKS
jgi:hypothetical protein